MDRETEAGRTHRVLLPSTAQRTRRSCARCGGARTVAPAPTVALPTARPSSVGHVPVPRSSRALDLVCTRSLPHPRLPLLFRRSHFDPRFWLFFRALQPPPPYRLLHISLYAKFTRCGMKCADGNLGMDGFHPTKRGSVEDAPFLSIQ
jgi:hypothetical protein